MMKARCRKPPRRLREREGELNLAAAKINPQVPQSKSFDAVRTYREAQ